MHVPAGVANRTVSRATVSAYLCPSDGYDGQLKFNATSGNYMVNWGNTSQDQREYAIGGVVFPFMGAPFSDMGAPMTDNPSLVTPLPLPPRSGTFNFSSIRDGLSNTMMVSEGIIGINGPSTDLRGFNWWGFAMYYTGFLAPNTTEPDVLQSASYCNWPQGDNPPCIAQTSALPMMNAARSRHPGGVNVTFSDGSVRFVKNTVDRNVYRGLSSSRGGEVISADQF